MMDSILSLRWMKAGCLALLLALCLVSPLASQASTEPHDAHAEEGKGEFKIAELLFHHILDSHNWHLFDVPAGDGHYTPVSIPLPWIVYSDAKGLDVFFLTGHSEAELQEQAAALGYELHHEHIQVAGQPDAFLLDLSITRAVAQMMLISLLMLLVFSAAAKGYAKNQGKAPRGVQSFMEPLVLFVRNDIAVPNLHGKHERFLPYLLTLFFFIWFANMLGLTPLNSNIMGNVSVTVALAVLTFFITQFSGSKDYWGHIFWFPGVPFFVKLIMLPVEIVGMFSKPFSLTIRLFANIAAGHFMVLSLISLIFLLGKQGESPAGAFAILPLSLAFNIFIMTLELLVAALQAYVFTLLTAVFIGMAMESHSHDAHEAHH